MNQRRNQIFLSAMAAFSLAGCTNTPHKVSENESQRTSYTEEQAGREITRAAAKSVDAHNFVEIGFSESSSVLTKSAAASIESAVGQAKQRGQISQVIVLSWSDQEYPAQNVGKLSKKQSDLADRRNLAIKKYVSAMDNLDVETYNMAKSPNTLSKWFNTTDTKLKNSFLAAGLPTTGDELQYPSKASHAVILVKVD
jgi:hypothetical protein